jgi:hypothetical protein
VDNSDLRDIRTSTVDYDGDGNVSEPIADEMATLHTALYAAIQDYAANVIGTPIIYEKSTFRISSWISTACGAADGDEASFGNSLPHLDAAPGAHRLQLQPRQQRPRRYAQNPEYILQPAYDSLEDLQQATPVLVS